MSPNRKPKQRGKKPAYGANKKAFDSVMQIYREAAKIDMRPPIEDHVLPVKDTEYFYDHAVLGVCRCNKKAENCKCKQFEIKGQRATPNPAKPTLADLRCDIDLVIKRLVADELVHAFWSAYVLYDSDDPIDMEIHADKALGPERHKLEQRLGAAFIRNGLFPVRRYFTTIRQRPSA